LPRGSAKITDSPEFSEPKHWRVVPGLDQLLASAAAPDAFMAQLVQVMRGIMGIEAAWIGRPNQDGLLLPEAMAAPNMPVFYDPGAMVNVRSGPTSQGPAGRAWRSGAAQLSNDVSADPTLATWRESWAAHGWRSGATVPLRGIGGVHRLLNLYSKQADFFRTTWPLELLTEFGLVIGTAIESRIKHAALGHSKRLLDTLFAGAETLLNATSEQEVLHGICEQLNTTGLFVSAAIGRTDASGEFRYDIASGPDASHVFRLRQRLDEAGTQHLLGVRAWKSEELQTADGYASLASLERWRDIAPAHWKAAAAAPILRGGKIFAVMFVVSDDVMVVDTETQRLIRQLVRIIGRALDQLDLKEALRTEREAQSKIARHDSLTQLPNRLAFAEVLPAALARVSRCRGIAGIGVLDLDNFKPVNDQYGHAAGDIVLRAVGARLRAALRDSDFVARLGGDEFALIMEDWTPAMQIDRLCDRLREAISQPVFLPDGNKVSVSFSLGLTFFPSDDAAPELLIRHADMALYAAKAIKGTRLRCWSVYQEASCDPSPALRYRDLLRDERISVHYQPVVDTATGEVVAVEALARLQDNGALILPGQFLPGFTQEDRKRLFDMVLRDGVALLRRLAVMAPRLSLSVNIDAEVLGFYPIMPVIEAALGDTGAENIRVTAQRITLELLESHDFPDADIAKTILGSLRNSGVKVAIDDMGMEFSNLKRVQQLQVDSIKIDKSFLRDVVSKPDDLVFLSTFQTLADWLGMQMCVEGIETLGMMDAARIFGVPLAQGHWIARPMPANRLEAWFGGYVPAPLRGGPQTLLGAFALHTRWLRVLMFDPRSFTALKYVRDNGPLCLTPFLRRNRLDNTPLGKLYAMLMGCCLLENPNMPALRRLADQVRAELAKAIIAEAFAKTSSRASLSGTARPAQRLVKPGKRIPDRAIREIIR
jgi:diguanylate cyclase (GGDEF)-like protein